MLKPKMKASKMVEGARRPCLTRFQLNPSMATVAPTFSLRTRTSASTACQARYYQRRHELGRGATYTSPQETAILRWLVDRSEGCNWIGEVNTRAESKSASDSRGDSDDGGNDSCCTKPVRNGRTIPRPEYDKPSIKKINRH